MAIENVKSIPFLNIPNAYVVISANKSDKAGGSGLVSNMSLFYCDNDKVGIEWEPNYGPITVIYSCKKDAEKSQKHWFFPYCTGYGNWSQLAVKKEGLVSMFLSGDYAGIFNVLKRWSDDHNM